MPATIKKIRIKIDGRETFVTEGTTVAAAALNLGVSRFRRSVEGQSRLPLCGMGVCFECRVTIDGRANQKSCQTLVADGMEIVTDA